LLGAEFTWVYAFRHGSRRGETKADSLTAEHRAVPTKSDVAAVSGEGTPYESVLTPSAILKRPSLKAQVLSAGIMIAVAAASEWALEQMAQRTERPKPLRRAPWWRHGLPFRHG
jgi:hypothetical protein